MIEALSDRHLSKNFELLLKGLESFPFVSLGSLEKNIRRWLLHCRTLYFESQNPELFLQLVSEYFSRKLDAKSCASFSTCAQADKLNTHFFFEVLDLILLEFQMPFERAFGVYRLGTKSVSPLGELFQNDHTLRGEPHFDFKKPSATHALIRILKTELFNANLTLSDELCVYTYILHLDPNHVNSLGKRAKIYFELNQFENAQHDLSSYSQLTLTELWPAELKKMSKEIDLILSSPSC